MVYYFRSGAYKMLHQMLKMLRLNSRMTQKQVAELLNVDRSTYTYYETGKIKPNVDTLVKLCCIFDVSMDVLAEIKGGDLDILKENVEEYLSAGEDAQTFTSLNHQEQRILLLFRLCRNKEEAIEKLKELALSAESTEMHRE